MEDLARHPPSFFLRGKEEPDDEVLPLLTHLSRKETCLIKSHDFVTLSLTLDKDYKERFKVRKINTSTHLPSSCSFDEDFASRLIKIGFPYCV